MAAELKARKDMDKRYMWDLTQIYKTNEDWEKAFVELQARIPEVGRYSGTMGTPAGQRRRWTAFTTWFTSPCSCIFMRNSTSRVTTATRSTRP